MVLDLLASPFGLIIAGYAAWYALKCAVAPWGRCRRCTGTGRDGNRRRPCRRCNGSGIRVRVGRRIYRWVRAEYTAGTDRKAPK
ncbi:hypothetical protein [Dactylosporangium sp. NPDC000521]|uniref:hypothetical protein n=1 Tax=Dactylosporangium sp. NPDC000521 TaxID=3363975 RepID=UPI0036B22E50